MFAGKTILITGGAGFFGKVFLERVLKDYPKIQKLIIYSRDEFKHFEIKEYNDWGKDSRLSFVLGNINDNHALELAMQGVDYIIHAAALKHLLMGEDNPDAFVQTNIYGTQNIIRLAKRSKVKRVILLSTDKAVEPTSLYGSTKMCAEKLFVNATDDITQFAVVRFGNILGASGSVLPHFLRMIDSGKLPLTDPKMTRFLVTPDQSVDFVTYTIEHMIGGEIFVPKVPSFKILDLIQAISPNTKTEVIGLRAGEKLHETLISSTESNKVRNTKDYYIIGKQAYSNTFIYRSDQNNQWYDVQQLTDLLLHIKKYL